MMKEETKPWYMSRTMWAAVCTAVVAVLQAMKIPIPNEIYAVLGALGLYGLRKASKQIE